MSPATERRVPRRVESALESLRAKAEAAKAKGVAAEELGGVLAGHREFERERWPDQEPADCDGMLRYDDQSRAVWSAVCDVCGFSVGVPMLRADPQRLKEHRLAHAGLPELFAEKQWERGDADQEPVLGVCRDWLKRFPSGGLPAPALYGPAGRGKSHLLVLMVRTLIDLYGTAAIYRSAVQMFEELQEAFGRPDEGTVWRRLTECEVLAIDDLAAERLTDWRADRFLSLVDTRYRNERPILLATNVQPGEWAERFTERVGSRLLGMTVPLELAGPDRRYQGQQLGMEAP